MVISRVKYFITAACLFLASCGDGGVQYVQSFDWNIHNQEVSFGVEFNPDVTLNTDVIIPIKNYGWVSLLSNNSGRGFTIQTTLDMAVIEDSDFFTLERTRRLPNEQPMSSYVETDVVRAEFKASEDVTTSLYLGLEPDQFYLGTSVELGFFDADFPSGLVLTQRIRDNLGRMLGVVTFYGPKVQNGEVVAPGGIFVMTNVSDLVRYMDEGESVPVSRNMMEQNGLMPDSETFVNQDEYRSMNKQYKLFQLYKKKGREAGLVD